MSAQHNDKALVYKDIRCMPEFSVVISFLEAFGERIGIRNVTAEDLENALINSENSTLVYTVHKNLLKELGKKIGADNWQRYLRREFIRRKDLNDVIGEYPFTDDEQVIAEDLANQPLFKKRKLDHIPSEETENPANTSLNNNIKKEKKNANKKRDLSSKEDDPKNEKIDLIAKDEQQNDELKKGHDNNDNDKKEGKSRKPEILKEDDESKIESEQSDKKQNEAMDEDSEDQEYNADVSIEEMQQLQKEEEDEMDADQYIDEEELTARRSSRLSQKFLPVEDLDLVRRSSRLNKRKREEEEENKENEGDGSGSDSEEGSEQEPAAAKKMINSYYHGLSPKTKVTILRNLCEWILDKPSDKLQKVAKSLQDTDMQRLRPDPIHIDNKKGDNYWYFGTISEERIYREHVEEREYKFKNSADLLVKDRESAKIAWTTLTTSLSEVQEFLKTLESDNKAKNLRDFINEEILPPLIAKQRKKDQAARRAASMDTLGLNRGNILRETRTRRRAATDSKCIYDIDSVLDWDNLK